MTREHKLALIVGFSLVLLVGVLISDHVSSARRPAINEVDAREGQIATAPGGVVPPDPTRSLALPGDPLRVAGAGGAAVPGPGSAGPANAASTPPGPMTAGQTQMAAGSPSAGLGAGPGGTMVAGTPGAEMPPPVKIVQGSGGTTMASVPGRDAGRTGSVLEQVREEVHRGLASAARTEGGEVVEQGPGKPALLVLPSSRTAKKKDGESDASDASKDTPSGRVETVTERTYVVAPGDTMFEIAAKFYGTGHVWRRLAEHNGIRGGNVRIGQRLRVPERPEWAPAVAQRAGSAEAAEVRPAARTATRDAGKPAGAAREAGTKAREAGPGAPNRATPARTTPKSDEPRSTTPSGGERKPRVEVATYTVRRGDTLGVIAQRTMGSARLWQRLAEFNKIEDGDELPAGKVLRIPPRQG